MEVLTNERSPARKVYKGVQAGSGETGNGGGVVMGEAARRLSLPTSTLANWVKAAKAGKLGEVGKNYRPLTEELLDLIAPSSE